MNNPLSTVNALTPAYAAPDAPASAAAGEAGAFALLLGGFTQTPALTPPLQNLATTALSTTLPAQGADLFPPALASMPVILPDDTPDAARTEPAATTQQPDAALIAALLGQMQMPNAMRTPAVPLSSPPAPVSDLRNSVAAPVADFAAVPALAQPSPALRPDAVNAVAAEQAGNDASAAATPLKAAGELKAAPQAALPGQAPVPRDMPTALASGVGTPQVPARAGSDTPAAVTPLKAASETKAGPDAALPGEAPALRDMPLASVAGVGTSPALTHGEPLPKVDSEARSGKVAVPSDTGNANSVEDTDNSQSARPQPHGSLGRAFELNATDVDRATGTETVAPLVVETAVATSPRAVGSKQPRDHGSDYAVAAAATPAALATRHNMPPSQVNIAPPLQAPEWQPAFANSVKLLVNEGTSTASLQLNPAEFGPIDVRIVVTDQRADISFMVTHPDANAAIQSALAELRDQLAHSGIRLGETSVGAHPQDRRPPADTPRHHAASKTEVAPSPSQRLTARPHSSGKIDIYA